MNEATPDTKRPKRDADPVPTVREQLDAVEDRANHLEGRIEDLERIAHEDDPQKRYASEYLTDLVASLSGVQFSATDQRRINKPLKAARDYLGIPE